MTRKTQHHAKIGYVPFAYDPDTVKCKCGKTWTAYGVSLTGGCVICPNCNSKDYMPEREHYD